MALPLPRVVADVGPGGGVVTAMRGMNALQKDMLNNKILGVKAEYAPQTTLADINSKNAYARLVGLQPIGKLLGNPDAFANLSEDEKRVVLDRFYRSGTGNSLTPSPDGQGSGMAGDNALSPTPQAQPTQPFSNWAADQLRDRLSNGQQAASSQGQPLPSQNAFSPENQPGLSPRDRQSLNALHQP